MAVAKNSAISLRCEMFDTDSQLLDETEEPIMYLRGGYDGIFPLVEEALYGKEVNDTMDVVLSPDDAFSEHDPELVRVEDVSVSPVEVEAGMTFETDDLTTSNVIIYRATDMADGEAVVDDNHPLVDMKIRFKAAVDSTRDTTDEEIAHGHTHGPYGHHH